jgi:MoxR-like ATPase
MSASTTLSIPEKFELLDTTLNAELLERTHEIGTALIALVARRHHLQIGRPGTAKSLLVRRLIKRIDSLDYEVTETQTMLDPSTGMPFDQEVTRQAAGYFQWLLTRYSTPEELFGPPSLAAMKRGEYKRVIRHKLPEAVVAFLDEVFKGNSSILNTLLTIMNERLFFNDADTIEVPLSTIFAASNEWAEGEELNAMVDRLHFRHEISPLQDGGSFIAMLSTPMDPEPETIISWEEILRAQQEAETVTLPGDIYEALKVLKDNLYKEGIEPSERRFNDSLAIIRAAAYLNGRDVAEINDMRTLQHVMWTRLDEQKEVTRKVLELANPIDREAQDLLERVESLESELTRAIKEADNPKAVAKAAVEVHGKLRKTKSRMDDLQKRCEENQRKSEKLEELNKRFVRVAKILVEEGFGVDSDPKLK